MEIQIPIIGKSNYNLSKFDFSFVDISIFDIDSKQFEDYIESQQPGFKEGNLSFINSIKEEVSNESCKKYAIVKNNPKKDFDLEAIYNVWKILLIIFPSDLQIEYLVNYEFKDDFFQRSYMTSNENKYTGEYPGDLLCFDDNYLVEVNEFIALCFDRIKGESYITLAIESYLTSFSALHYHFQYLTLCMSLESIIYGSQELTYRLKRSIGLLCGEKPISCNIIFDNINKLYSLRSNIIHGEKYDIPKIQEYLKPLKFLVSRTIIELLIHNISNKKELNSKITELGYGDKEKISDNYKQYKLNILTFAEVNYRKIK